MLSKTEAVVACVLQALNASSGNDGGLTRFCILRVSWKYVRILHVYIYVCIWFSDFRTCRVIREYLIQGRFIQE